MAEGSGGFLIIFSSPFPLLSPLLSIKPPLLPAACPNSREEVNQQQSPSCQPFHNSKAVLGVGLHKAPRRDFWGLSGWWEWRLGSDHNSHTVSGILNTSTGLPLSMLTRYPPLLLAHLLVGSLSLYQHWLTSASSPRCLEAGSTDCLAPCFSIKWVRTVEIPARILGQEQFLFFSYSWGKGSPWMFAPWKRVLSCDGHLWTTQKTGWGGILVVVFAGGEGMKGPPAHGHLLHLHQVVGTRRFRKWRQRHLCPMSVDGGTHANIKWSMTWKCFFLLNPTWGSLGIQLISLSLGDRSGGGFHNKCHLSLYFQIFLFLTHTNAF